MKLVNIETARAQLADVIEGSQGEPVLLTRHGRPVAVLLGVAGVDLNSVIEEGPRMTEVMEKVVAKSKRARIVDATARNRFGLPPAGRKVG